MAEPCPFPPPPLLSPVLDSTGLLTNDWGSWCVIMVQKLCELNKFVLENSGGGGTEFSLTVADGSITVTDVTTITIDPELTLTDDGGGTVTISDDDDAGDLTGTDWVWGDGSDGSVDFNGTNTFSAFATTTGSAPNLVYTLTRPIWTTECFVRTGKSVFMPDRQIFCQGTLTVDGTIHANGSNNTVNKGTGQPGAGIGSNGVYAGGANSGSGGNGVSLPAAGTNTTNNGSIGGNGGAGGASSQPQSGGAAGAASSTSFTEAGTIHFAALPQAMIFGFTRAGGTVAPFCGGAGGGGGGGVTSTCTGGGGGSGAGVLGIFAKLIAGGGTITAVGGDGNRGDWQAAGGGGGGGGGGGAILLVTTTTNWASLVTTSVAGGAGGATTGGGSSGSNGSAGNLFSVIL